MKGLITMSKKEANRIALLDKLLKGEMKQKKAAETMGVTVRQVRRLIKKYKKDGASALVHKLRGFPSNHKVSEDRLSEAIKTVKEKYVDFSVTMAHEKLTQLHRINFSRETLRLALISEGLLVPKEKTVVKLHQMRERRALEGELVMVDGSPHDWFEGRGGEGKCTLLVFVDDATGKLLHLEFCQSESTNSYFVATGHYLLKHGKPVALYTDKHGVFRINSAHKGEGATSDENGDTQFGRAMRELSIELIFASSPEAKGRVERANQTLQDRLVKEMRLAGINSMIDGNLFLEKFMEEFNRKFAVIPRQSGNAHRALLPCDSLGQILTNKQTRVLSKQLSFQHGSKLCQIKTDRPTYAMRHASVEVRENPSGEVSVFYQGKKLNYEVLTTQPKAYVADSKQINLLIDQTKEKLEDAMSHTIPSPNHPWRRAFVYS